MPEEGPTFFPEPTDFWAWLDENHASADHLWVGYYKKASGKPSVTWEETVAEALCYGWIDGIRKSRDDESFAIRFTPRNYLNGRTAVKRCPCRHRAASANIATRCHASETLRTPVSSRWWFLDCRSRAFAAPLPLRFLLPSPHPFDLCFRHSETVRWQTVHSRPWALHAALVS